MTDWLGDVALRMHVKAWKLKSACDGFMMCGEGYICRPFFGNNKTFSKHICKLTIFRLISDVF